MGHPVYGWSLSPSCLMYSFNDVCWTIESLTNLTSDVLKIVPLFKNDRLRNIPSLFCRLYVYLSQILGSDGHFEVSNMSKN